MTLLAIHLHESFHLGRAASEVLIALLFLIIVALVFLARTRG